ncbi:translation initiation factor IF-5A [Candidatus Woesearchaeota archaeon]|nr:translation initiation factor IF-5A [Candidatus Woesearchaeota archaeon]
MEKKVSHVGALQKGSLVIIDGEACKVMSTQVSRPGKHGHAKVRFDAVGIIDGKKRNIVLPAHDNIEVPLIDKRNAQVLSIAGNKANVMDNETFETFDMEIPEEVKDVTEGCNILYWVILGTKIMKQVVKGDE